MHIHSQFNNSWRLVFLGASLGVLVGAEVPVRLQSFSAGALTAFASFLHLLVFEEALSHMKASYFCFSFF